MSRSQSTYAFVDSKQKIWPTEKGRDPRCPGWRHWHVCHSPCQPCNRSLATGSRRHCLHCLNLHMCAHLHECVCACSPLLCYSHRSITQDWLSIQSTGTRWKGKRHVCAEESPMAQGPLCDGLGATSTVLICDYRMIAVSRKVPGLKVQERDMEAQVLRTHQDPNAQRQAVE